MKQFIINNKITLGIVLVLVLLLVGGYKAYANFQEKRTQQIAVEEQDLSFDAEGPYAMLFPRKDGNALILNLKRTASYDSISYELAYVSKPDDAGIKSNAKAVVDEGDSAIVGGVDRGVMGTINTQDKKGEYEQEILFGTCSKNVCKYDKGVENGTLTLHIRKGDLAYRMVTQWHIQRPDVALGVLSSGDRHFTYKLDNKKDELTLVGFSIVNDLTGLPKLPSGKSVVGKAYSLNVPQTKTLPSGKVQFELADTPEGDLKIARFDEVKGSWDMLETKVESGKLTATATGAGVYAIFK